MEKGTRAKQLVAEPESVPGGHGRSGRSGGLEHTAHVRRGTPVAFVRPAGGSEAGWRPYWWHGVIGGRRTSAARPDPVCEPGGTAQPAPIGWWDRLKPGLGVWTILIELGSTRPVVVHHGHKHHAALDPRGSEEIGYGGGPESSSGRCSTTDFQVHLVAVGHDAVRAAPSTPLPE